MTSTDKFFLLLSFFVYTAQSHSAEPDIHYTLGNAYLRRDMLDEAEREYQTVLSLQFDYRPAINNLGIVLEKKGQIQKAYGMYARASLLEPKKDYSQKNMFRLAESFGFSASSACAAETGSIFNHSPFGELLLTPFRRK